LNKPTRTLSAAVVLRLVERLVGGGGQVIGILSMEWERGGARGHSQTFYCQPAGPVVRSDCELFDTLACPLGCSHYLVGSTLCDLLFTHGQNLEIFGRT
jgi:hypothetical protein